MLPRHGHSYRYCGRTVQTPSLKSYHTLRIVATDSSIAVDLFLCIHSLTTSLSSTRSLPNADHCQGSRILNPIVRADEYPHVAKPWYPPTLARLCHTCWRSTGNIGISDVFRHLTKIKEIEVLIVR
jgi:hypothetical protein